MAAALPGGQAAGRDSKNPDGPALIFTGDEVAEWIGALKAGRHDDLVTGS